MPPTAFGLWLKTQRETLGLSQHQLAVQLGLSQHQLAVQLGTTANTISRWETGARACALGGAVRLALEALHTRHAAQRIEITEPIVPPEPPEVPDAGIFGIRGGHANNAVSLSTADTPTPAEGGWSRQRLSEAGPPRLLPWAEPGRCVSF